MPECLSFDRLEGSVKRGGLVIQEIHSDLNDSSAGQFDADSLQVP